MVISTIFNICVANNISIIVFLFYIDSIADSTMHIMYNINIIYVYKIRFSQENMHTITVDFPQMNI